MFKRIKAEEFNARGQHYHERGKIDKAIESYRKATAAAPTWATPWYNLGLVYKTEKQWKKSCECSLRAAELDPKYQPAWWNLGIAATALGQWNLARQAWKGYGVKLPDGEGPVELSCGFGPIRINPTGEAEVVWAERIDPARSILASIPFPESGHGWRDLVLNDGAPNGYRKYQGQRVPVLDELELLKRSVYGTYVARIGFAESDSAKDVATLLKTAESLDACVEDWSTSVRMLCKACSEGKPHEMHDTGRAPPDGVHIIGIAAKSNSEASRILSTWQSDAKDVRIDSLDDALEPGES